MSRGNEKTKMFASGGELMGATYDIYTFGDFEIKNGRDLITEGVKRYSKRWKLLQYLITYKERRITRDKLIMELDLNSNSDPEGALSALVYRLRSFLRKTRDGQNDVDFILTRGGTYTFNDNLDYWLDTEEFESLCSQIRNNIGQDADSIAEDFSRAINLYRGDYLEEIKTEEWVWTARNYYRNLLVNTLLDIDDFLREENRHDKLWELYDQVHRLVRFDERLAIGSIKTLLEAGREGLARLKYEEIVNIFKENDYALPQKLKELGLLLNNGERERRGDPSALIANLKERAETEGAFVCEPDTFIKLYDLEKRRVVRYSIPRHLVHLRLKGEASDEDLKEQGDNLMNILENHLRAGDVVCRWNSRHFIILLINISHQVREKIVERIKNSFLACCNPPDWLEFKSGFFDL